MTRLFQFPARRLIAAVAVTGLLMVPLAIFGGPALAYTASAMHQYGKPSSAQYQYKVTVCHHTGSGKHSWHQITISNRAVAAHLRHGDQMPPCPAAVTQKHHGKPAGASSQSESSQSSKQHENEHANGSGKASGNGHHGKS